MRPGLKRFLKRLALGAALLFVGIQLWPAGRTNPPATAGLDAPAEVIRILRRSCYDCHSHETRWPWYAYVAPVSWFVVHDVDEGRAELNFSEWGALSPEKREKRAARMIDEIDSDAMPLRSYLRMHPKAKVSPEELAVLEAWADGAP